MPLIPVVIVGAGPAGGAAAVQCRRLGVEPLLVDASGRAGGLVANAHLVENYPGLEAPVSGEVLAGRLRAHLERFGVEVTRGRATGLRREAEGFAVKLAAGETVHAGSDALAGGGAHPAQRGRLADGATLRARSVVIATGTGPRRLGVPGEADLAGRRVFYEVRALLAAVPEPRTVAVVGAGEAACDQARTLAAAGAQVVLLARGERLRARGRLADAVLAQPGVTVRYGTACRRLHPDGMLTLHGPSGEAERRPDAVLVAVGRERAFPAGAAELLAVGRERVFPAGAERAVTAERPESRFQSGPATPVPGLFVVGDARTGSLGQVGMAVGDGLAAAARVVDFLEG